MKRTTMMIPEELRERARRYCLDKNISLGQFVRESMATYLARDEKSIDWSKDLFFLDKAVYDGSAPSDLAENHDKYLYDEEQ